MKKIAVFVLVLVMTTGFVIAQNIGFSTAPEGPASASASDSGSAKGSGISVGIEAGFIDFLDMNNTPYTHMYIMPTFSFDGYLSDALVLNAELGVPFFPWDPEFWLGADIDLWLTYNMGNLSIFAENALAIPIKKYEAEFWDYVYYRTSYEEVTYSPMFGHISETRDNLYPGIRYSLSSGIGTLYFRATLPIRIIPDPFGYVGMNFSLGLNGNNGFRFWIRENNNLQPTVKFFRGLDLFASFNAGSLYGELYVEIPTYEGGMESEGVSVTPMVEFGTAKGFRFYIELPIEGIGAEYEWNKRFGLTVGAKMSF